MSDPHEELAEAAVAAMNQASTQQTTQQDAPSEEGGHESTGADPVTALAKALAENGVGPDKARGVVDYIASMQTPQGQREWYESFLRTEQGAQMTQQAAMEHLANMAASNPKAVFNMLTELGYAPPAPERTVDTDDELSPAERSIKAIEAQQAALAQELKQLKGENQALKQESQVRSQAEVRRDAWFAWTKTQPPMAAKAYAAVSRRAADLAALSPQQYAGQQGYMRALNAAHSELASAAQFFQPKPRPVNGSGGGGGVAGRSADDTKGKSLSDLIESLSTDFERTARSQG